MILAARYIKKKAERKKNKKKKTGNIIPPFKLQISIWKDKPQKLGS